MTHHARAYPGFCSMKRLGVHVSLRVRTLFSETNFQNFSRTQIDFSRSLKFTLTPTLPRSQCYCNSPYCLPYTSYFLVEFNRFPELSRTSGLFPGLSSPGKCQNKIPGLSRFSRTCTNPDFYSALDGMLVHQRVIPAINLPVPVYTPGWREAL